jgi:hypothetical protein
MLFFYQSENAAVVAGDSYPAQPQLFMVKFTRQSFWRVLLFNISFSVLLYDGS